MGVSVYLVQLVWHVEYSVPLIGRRVKLAT